MVFPTVPLFHSVHRMHGTLGMTKSCIVNELLSVGPLPNLLQKLEGEARS